MKLQTQSVRSSSDTSNFYTALAAYDNFLEVLAPAKLTAIPQDWTVLITDVVGSTRAIAAGLYKQVNLAGACSIVAVLNITGNVEIPFIFGGDGATLLVPPSLRQAAIQALLGTRHAVKQGFGLDLRVAAVPVQVARAAGYEIKVSKFRVSENYIQAIVVGGGLSYVEQLVKSHKHQQIYGIAPEEQRPTVADFAGLECRWQDITSPHGETLSLIVQAMAQNLSEHPDIYQAAIAQVRAIYGQDMAFCPVAPERLTLAFGANLQAETRMKSAPNWWARQQTLGRIWLENLLGLLMMRFKVKVDGMDWGNYKQIVTTATDYRKVDDVLRLVISGSRTQRQQLEAYLEERFQAGHLVHGLHISNRALMTCLIFERNGRQVHFLDAADGGYALAAKALKAKLKLQHP